MKLFGIPIKIEVSFFAVVIFLALSRSTNFTLLVEWIVVVFLSVLLHEFGHALAARAFGLSPEIRLYQMGGLTSWRSDTRLTPGKHLIISLSGPAAGFVFGGVVFLMGPLVFNALLPRVSLVVYYDLLWVNVGWGVFNLLPMLPLDGGQVLTTLEEWFLRRKDQLVSHALSFLVALAITAAAFAGRAVWIAFLGIFFVYINGSFLLRTLQAHRDQKLRPQLDKIKEAVDKGETDLALELIAKVQKRAKSPDTKREAARLLIFLHLKLENYEQAEIELRRSTVLFGEDPFLQGMLHFRKGETTAAIPHLRAIFDSWPQKESGLMLHQSLIADKDFVGALELCAHPALAEVKQATCVDLQVEAFKNEQFKISVQAGLLAYEHKADANVAFNLACALARDAQLEAALKWLRVAVDSGFNNKEALLSDPDIEAVRSLPGFSSIVAKANKIGD